jgi:hypothetical protein
MKVLHAIKKRDKKERGEKRREQGRGKQLLKQKVKRWLM